MISCFVSAIVIFFDKTKGGAQEFAVEWQGQK
jgi:hypothetical protein